MQRSQVTTVGLILPTNIPCFAERYFCLIYSSSPSNRIFQALLSFKVSLSDTHHGIIESDLLNFSPL